MAINFPKDIKSSKCEKESRTLNIPTRHGNKKVTVQINVESRNVKPVNRRGKTK